MDLEVKTLDAFRPRPTILKFFASALLSIDPMTESGGMSSRIVRLRNGPMKTTEEMDKVFCIGLHKTGTSSLCDLANKLGFRPLHSCNWASMSPQLSALSKYNFFADGGGHFWWKSAEILEDFWGPCHNVSFLHHHFPRARFILNTRSLDEWLRSKLYHAGWRYNTILTEQSRGLIAHDWRVKSLSVVEDFVRCRIAYHAKVISFFRKKQREQQLLVIDYVGDSLAGLKIGSFLSRPISDDLRPHKNRSPMTEEDQTYIDAVVGQVFDRLRIKDPKSIL